MSSITAPIFSLFVMLAKCHEGKCAFEVIQDCLSVTLQETRVFLINNLSTVRLRRNAATQSRHRNGAKSEDNDEIV